MEALPHTILALESRHQIEAKPLDMRKVAEEFEETYSSLREYHVIINQENGEQGEVATCGFPINDESRHLSGEASSASSTAGIDEANRYHIPKDPRCSKFVLELLSKMVSNVGIIFRYIRLMTLIA